MNYNFKRQHAFSDRQRESIRVLNSYPDRIPIICERSDLAPVDCPYIDKKKISSTQRFNSWSIYICYKK